MKLIVIEHRRTHIEKCIEKRERHRDGNKLSKRPHYDKGNINEGVNEQVSRAARQTHHY